MRWAGSVYTTAADNEARISLFRLEIAVTAGTGELRTPGGLEPSLKESLNRAFAYVQNVKDKLGPTSLLAQKDIQAEAVDLSGSRVDCPCSVAFYVTIMSVLYNRRILAGTVVLGDLTVQGNVKGTLSIMEPLQIAMENGALRALQPIANKNQMAGLLEDVIEGMMWWFFGDPERAVSKKLEG
jgi:ATP-dependent Lon protease